MTKNLNELDLKTPSEKELNKVFEQSFELVSTYAHSLNECEEKTRLMNILGKWKSINDID